MGHGADGRMEAENSFTVVSRDFYLDGDLLALHGFARSGEEEFCQVRFAAENAETLRQPAQIARGKAEPAARGGGLLIGKLMETIEGDCVQFGQP